MSGQVVASPAVALDEVGERPSVVAIGFFDGVHRGHQAILRRAYRRARALRADGEEVRTVALTFDRHPASTVAPDDVPPLIMTHERRMATLAESADIVVAVPFTNTVAHLGPEDFVEQMLRGRLHTSSAVVGDNFRFGRRAEGDVATLRRLGLHHGFDVETVELLDVAGVTISSSEIRARLDDGDVRWAARALGRPPAIEGRVVSGDGRGRGLGVPTANLAVSSSIQLPAIGIYAGWARTASARLRAATSIGVRPTFGGGAVTVETHLLDWDGDLYGEHLVVDLRFRLRGEEHFDSVEALKAQMDADIAATRELLAGA